MTKSKHFAFIVVILVAILLIVGNWVTPAQANSANIITPTPTDWHAHYRPKRSG
jgi:heme A synthase